MPVFVASGLTFAANVRAMRVGLMARHFSMPLFPRVRDFSRRGDGCVAQSGPRTRYRTNPQKTDAPEINKMKKHAGKGLARMDVLEV